MPKKSPNRKLDASPIPRITILLTLEGAILLIEVLLLLVIICGF